MPRKPYTELPERLLENGFVSDLVTTMTGAAESLGMPIYNFQKNGRWFIAVRVPDAAELARLDDKRDYFELGIVAAQHTTNAKNVVAAYDVARKLSPELPYGDWKRTGRDERRDFSAGFKHGKGVQKEADAMA